MAALNLNANLPVYIQWSDDAALTLIQRRRAYQPLFTTTRNPEGYSTRTPTLYDERFHQELSDEFWRVEPLVRATRRNRMDRALVLDLLTTESAGALILDLPTTKSAGALTDMRRRYSHNKPIEPIRIRNRFSYSKPNETTDSDERVAIRSPVRSPDNDNDDMDFQYDHKDDLSFQDINDDDNAYGSINPQDYNDEMIFSQDNVNSSDTEEEEESDNEYNYEEEEEEEDNNENNDEEEEDEGNNDDNNNQKRNNDEEERNNEEEEIHQIVEALDEDKIPFCNGQFAPYFDNYTTTALFCWLQKHNVSTKAYEDLVDIIHNSQFEPTHVVKNIRRFQSWRKRLPLLPIITKVSAVSAFIISFGSFAFLQSFASFLI
ncbi:hypothetical protein GLOIN_2v1790940 [Rhizophagus irregularis DAOM 181602=DAOM 197198]|nr:hypothetical protein GLOIN_2v1790940 [Rhizophagus irregularis DAOM 181602=DAOM 197198]